MIGKWSLVSSNSVSFRCVNLGNIKISAGGIFRGKECLEKLVQELWGSRCGQELRYLVSKFKIVVRLCKIVNKIRRVL